jgi:predicted nucleic acid-binding protein
VNRPGVSARDAVHVAVMERRGVGLILSFDPGFDAVPGIRRVPAPAQPSPPATNGD